MIAQTVKPAVEDTGGKIDASLLPNEAAQTRQHTVLAKIGMSQHALVFDEPHDRAL
jgi:hypothetical protein